MGLTDDPQDPSLTRGVDAPDSQPGMAETYLVLSEAERAAGFVRPVRLSYIHTVCGTVTRMAQAIAETYARNPGFYGSTYCAHCRNHRPVGPDGEFVWDYPGGEKVGT